jgi:hypothetical protein
MHILQRVINAHGGKIVEHLTGACGIDDKSCIMVPFNGSKAVMQSIRNDLNGLVTDLWLEKCLSDRILHDPQSSVVFQPLPVDIECSEFRKYCISVTGFEGLDRDYISALIKHLGNICRMFYSRSIDAF